MIASLISTIDIWIQQAGGLGVFVASIVEELISFIPSSMVQLGAGFFLLDHAHITIDNIWRAFSVIALPASLGVMLGSLPFFALGYYGGEPAIRKYGKYFFISYDEIEKFQNRLQRTRTDDFIYIILRATPIIPSIVLAVGAGILKIPIRVYVICTIIGVIIRALILAFIGASMGQAYTTAASAVEAFERIGWTLLILCVLYFIIRLVKKKFFT